jgi:mono/diheme cytochrome c family protein
MNRSGVFGIAAVLATTAVAQAQMPVERGRYLVDTIMTCHNCHTPRGPNGPQFDKALSGGLRFNEAPFDVTGSNITSDPRDGHRKVERRRYQDSFA